MSPSAAQTLITKLRVSNRLDADDLKAIHELPIDGRSVAARQIVVHDGDRPRHCCLLIDGFMCRSKNTPDGQRQILSLHIAGEIPDLQSLHLKVMDHDLSTLTACQLGFVSHDAMLRLTRERPNVAAALWRETLIDAAIFREWIVNVGRRAALARLAHLISETRTRLKSNRTYIGWQFSIPLSLNRIWPIVWGYLQFTSIG
jgi:CRP-like cAMP-binding protein